MKYISAIGVALIDFIPEERGCRLKDVSGFKRVCGGAPANVAAAIALLGGKSRIITKLGEDAFGDYIVDTLNQAGAYNRGKGHQKSRSFAFFPGCKNDCVHYGRRRSRSFNS